MVSRSGRFMVGASQQVGTAGRCAPPYHTAGAVWAAHEKPSVASGRRGSGRILKAFQFLQLLGSRLPAACLAAELGHSGEPLLGLIGPLLGLSGALFGQIGPLLGLF